MSDSPAPAPALAPLFGDLPARLQEWTRSNAPPAPVPSVPLRHPGHPGQLYWREVSETRSVATTLPDEPEADAAASGYLAELALREGAQRWTASLTLRGALVFFAIGGGSKDAVRVLCQDAMARERECELAGLCDPQLGEGTP